MSLRPVLGLLQQDVGRLVADLARVSYKRYAYATIQTGAFTLIPDAAEREIVFEPYASVESAAERVCAPILDPGLDWMRQNASLEAIYTLLTTNSLFRGSIMYTFTPPIIAWMLGKPELAREQLDERRRRILERAGPNLEGALAVQERFRTALEARMAEGPWKPAGRV